MAYIRKIKVEYFRVYIEKKNGDDNGKEYNLEELIIKADAMSLEERKFSYYQEEARLDKILFEKSTKYWYMNFLRLRQTKLPLFATLDQEAEGFGLGADEYIGEDITTLYDPTNNIFVVQRNIDSLSASGLERYLTELLNESEYRISLRPFLDENVAEKLGNAKTYRKMTLKFASDRRERKVIPQNSSLNRLFEYFNQFDAKSVTLSMSLGRGNRRGSLDQDSINSMLQEMNESDGFVVGGELSVKYNEIDPVETIDLFTMKVIDVIPLRIERLESISFEKMSEEICIKYNQHKKELIK